MPSSGVEQWQLAGFMGRRSGVRVASPQQMANEVREGVDLAAMAITAFADDVRALFDDLDERHGHGHRRSPKRIWEACCHVYVRKRRIGVVIADATVRGAFSLLCPPGAR